MTSKLKFELVWWLISLVLIILFLLPIFTTLNQNYPFYQDNIIFILVFVTLTRFIFLTRFHWFAWSIPVKAVMIFLAIPLFVLLIDRVTTFQAFLDEEGLYSIMGSIETQSQKNLGRFIKTEMLFFWVGAFLSTILLPFAMMRSIWLQKNRNRV